MTQQVASQSVFWPLLAVLFIGLKLTGYVAWSWWWVLAPLWLPLAFVLVVAGIAAIVAAVLVVLRR